MLVESGGAARRRSDDGRRSNVRPGPHGPGLRRSGTVPVVDVPPEQLGEFGRGTFFDLLGIELVGARAGGVQARLELRPDHLAPNGYLHAGTVVGFADSMCGFGTMLSLPDGAVGFTTIELKTSFLRTATSGVIEGESSLVHGGRTTQIWDASVRDPDGRPMALFRCTQLLLHPR